MGTAARSEPACATARGEIVPLTGLRGLAAAWVFLYHAIELTGDLDPLLTRPLRAVGTAGYLGVDLFFVLSGFVIAYHYVDAPLHRSWRDYVGFLWKRLARIWPAHTAALLFFSCGLAIYSPSFDLSLTGFLRSLTMTQAWDFPARQIWNPVAWSVSCEWAAYLVFPAIALMTRRLSVRMAVLGIALAYLALYLAFRIGPMGEGPFSLGLQRIAASFTAGALVFRIWSLRRVPMDVAGWCALGALICGASVIDMRLQRGLSMPEATMLGCVVVYALACSKGSLVRPFARLRHAGCISYSFYLVHWVPLAIARTLLDSAGVTTSAAWVYCAILSSLVIAVALAEFLYRFVEEPGRRWMLAKQPQPILPRRTSVADPGTHTAATGS